MKIFHKWLNCHPLLVIIHCRQFPPYLAAVGIGNYYQAVFLYQRKALILCLEFIKYNYIMVRESYCPPFAAFIIFIVQNVVFSSIYLHPPTQVPQHSLSDLSILYIHLSTKLYQTMHNYVLYWMISQTLSTLSYTNISHIGGKCYATQEQYS